MESMSLLLNYICRQLYENFFIIRDMYRCARGSEWGDRLPLHYEQQENLEAEKVESETSKNENT